MGHTPVCRPSASPEGNPCVVGSIIDLLLQEYDTAPVGTVVCELEYHGMDIDERVSEVFRNQYFTLRCVISGGEIRYRELIPPACQ